MLGTADQAAASTTLIIPLTASHPVIEWSEFSPKLYLMRVELLRNRTVVDRRETSFGFRHIAHDSNRLLINGHPAFMRGNIDRIHFPKTGYPSTDKQAWLAIFRKYRDHNLNHVRFHSWCPPQAAFQAADELGPSDFSVTGRWVGELKHHAPRRLYAASTARTITANCDFNATHNIPGIGCCRQHYQPDTAWDYEPIYRKAPVPILAHGFDLTGLVPPTFEPIAQPVSDFHLNRKLASIFETRVSSGRLLVCGYNLDQNLPEVRQLRHSLLQYAASAGFQPPHELPLAKLRKLLEPAAGTHSSLPDKFKDAGFILAAAGLLSDPGAAPADPAPT